MSNRVTLVRSGLFLLLFVLVIGGTIVVSSMMTKGSIVLSGRTRGNPAAPISLVEFGDFQ